MDISPELLALDHLTVADTTPSQLVAVAAEAGCPAVCVFLEPLDVLPRMPRFDLIGDTRERRDTRSRCEDFGISIDLAYPFTLASRTQVEAFRPLMETAAWLGVRSLNTLLYDRDHARRVDRFAAFCELASQYRFTVAVEFYPLSQVRSLEDALQLIAQVDRPETVGVNIDLLHLVRSGGRIEDIGAVPPGSIVYAQFCDGPRTLAQEHWGAEASSQRLLPGAGQFDVTAFAAALPQGVPCSVEVPQDLQISQGVGVHERAVQALEATRRLISRGAEFVHPPARGCE